MAPVPAQLARCCPYTNSVQAIRLCRVCRPVSCLLSISILLSHKTLTDDRERNVEELTTLLSQSLRAGGIDNMYLRSQSKINIILCQTRPCLHSVGSLHPDLQYNSYFYLGSTSSKGKRYYATEDDDLSAPLLAGWRRETTIREYTKSGIRGEVVYVAPCGKRFKQYPDIIRVSNDKVVYIHK